MSKKIVFALPVLLMLLASLIVLKSGFFNIKKIDIEGEPCAGYEEIKNASALMGQNFFLVNKAKTEKLIKKKFICIKSAEVSKFLPDKVNLKIQNRQGAAILASLKSEASSSATPSAEDVKDYELIDDEGVIFGKAGNNLNLPQIFGYNFNDTKVALKILQKLKVLGLEIRESFLGNNIFVVNSLPTVSKITFSLRDTDIQLASLQLILDQAKIDGSKIEFIDLRFDKPVVKFAPKK